MPRQGRNQRNGCTVVPAPLGLESIVMEYGTRKAGYPELALLSVQHWAGGARQPVDARVPSSERVAIKKLH